jgi:hypothetical protein
VTYNLSSDLGITAINRGLFLHYSSYTATDYYLVVGGYDGDAYVRRILFSTTTNTFTINSTRAIKLYHQWGLANCYPDVCNADRFYIVGNRNANLTIEYIIVNWDTYTSSKSIDKGLGYKGDSGIYNNRLYITTGDGTYSSLGNSYFKINDTFNAIDGSVSINRVYLSHNCNFMVYNGTFYSCVTGNTAMEKFNNKVSILSGLPSYDYVLFTSDDKRFILVSTYNVYWYEYNSSGFALERTTSITNTSKIGIIWDSKKYILVTPNELYLVGYDDTPSSIIKTLTRDHLTYRYISPSETPKTNQVLENVIFAGSDGIATGTMPNNGALNYTPTTSSQSIPAGYTSGGVVNPVTSSIDANIIPSNIKLGTTILGVAGNLEPDKPDQTKTATPTTSQQVIEPDTGYELASVTINPVTSSIDANIQARNIKKDVTILGVTGTLESGDTGVKLFDTVEHMQADPNQHVDDIGVVYRSEIQPLTADTEFSKVYFPETVVLTTAIQDYVQLAFRPVDTSQYVDLWGSIDSQNFDMSYYGDSGEIRVAYSSQDGLTYTRTTFPQDVEEENVINFGLDLKFESQYATWDNSIGQFMKVPGGAYDGIYQNKVINDDSVAIGYQNLEVVAAPTAGITYDEVNVKCDVIETAYQLVRTQLPNAKMINGYSSTTFTVEYIDDNHINFYVAARQESYGTPWRTAQFLSNYLYDQTDDGIYLCSSIVNYSGTNGGINKVTVDLANETAVETAVASTLKNLGTETGNSKAYVADSSIDITHKWLYYSTYQHFNDNTYGVVCVKENGASVYHFNFDPVKVKKNYYLPAPTQFTLSDDNQLLPGVVALGKSGTVTGDGSIYTEMPLVDRFTQIYKLSGIGSGNNYNWYGRLQNNITYSTSVTNMSHEINYLVEDANGTMDISRTTTVSDTSKHPGAYWVDMNSAKTRYIYLDGNNNRIKINDATTGENLWSVVCTFKFSSNATYDRKNWSGVVNDYLYYMYGFTLKRVNVNTLVEETVFAPTDIASYTDSYRSYQMYLVNNKYVIFIYQAYLSNYTAAQADICIYDTDTNTVLTSREKTSNNSTANCNIITTPQNIYFAFETGYHGTSSYTKLDSWYKFDLSLKEVSTLVEDAQNCPMNLSLSWDYGCTASYHQTALEDNNYIYMKYAKYNKSTFAGTYSSSSPQWSGYFLLYGNNLYKIDDTNHTISTITAISGKTYTTGITVKIPNSVYHINGNNYSVATAGDGTGYMIDDINITSGKISFTSKNTVIFDITTKTYSTSNNTYDLTCANTWADDNNIMNSTVPVHLFGNDIN